MRIGNIYYGEKIQMISPYNPFKENRTEQMKDLWKYYVPIPGFDGSAKPLVVEGGRGSGKTMLFMCNSWRIRLQEIKKEKRDVNELFLNQPFIGLYYRVDTAFVSAMIGKEKNHWREIFETYLGICLLREMLDFLRSINLEPSPFDNLKLIEFVKSFSTRFNQNSTSENLDEFFAETDYYLNYIEDIINGNVERQSIRLIKLGRFIIDLCNNINKLLNCNNLYKVFIDEYETLLIYQQRVINTLIKHSSSPVVFNIGLRLDGMQTNKTIGRTETIESPHDYEVFSINNETISYRDILIEICKKRIQYGKEMGKIPVEASDNIEYYLGNYSINEEISLYSESRVKPKYINELRKIIVNECRIHNVNKEIEEKYISVLCDDAPLLNSMIHYLLLKRTTSYTPHIQDLFDAYIQNSKRYEEWVHNRKFGAVFLLARSFHKNKMYYGFDVFSALSSGIIRYFLELCEQAFNIAFLNDDFNWTSPIDYKEQSSAVGYVSKYKIEDINIYAPYGKELRIFIQYLGKIFNYCHISDEINLGEPEPNHFSTNDLALPSTIIDILSSAIRCDVLQVKTPTKRKKSTQSPETVDYYINKIYTPYFNISYRDKRKLHISEIILKELLSGEDAVASKAANKYLKQKLDEDKKIKDMAQGYLFDNGENNS